jgi:hypothetical protein
MQESQTEDAMKKRHDRGILIKVLLVRPPGLQGTTGHVEHLGRLTLEHPLGFELAIALKLPRPFEALPALMVIRIATLRVWDDRSHSYPLLRSFACVRVMAKDSEVAFWF